MEHGGGGPPNRVRLLGDFGQAESVKRAPVAVGLTDRRGGEASGQQTADILDGLRDCGPEFGRELHLPASARSDVKDGSPWHGHTEHVLQAEALRAGMEVVVLPLPPRPPFVLDGVGDLGTVGCGPEFNYIRPAGEPQAVREQWEAANNPHARPFLGPGVVYFFVRHAATECRGVLHENPLDVDQRAPSRTEGEVVKRRDRDLGWRATGVHGTVGVAMGPLKIKAVVSKDHRVDIAVPPEVPEGPVDIEMTITPETAIGGSDDPQGIREVLGRLREFRKQFEGRDIRLSDAVIELRREGDWRSQAS